MEILGGGGENKNKYNGICEIAWNYTDLKYYNFDIPREIS